MTGTSKDETPSSNTPSSSSGHGSSPGAHLELTTHSPSETQQIGRQIATILRPGDVLSLAGDLGAGKTCFVQGIAQGIGVTEPLTSPSFLLRKDYQATLTTGEPVTLAHLDIYRLDTFHDLDVIGLDEEPDVIWVIEWGDAASAALGDHRLDIHLAYPDGDMGNEPEGGLDSDGAEQVRTITIDGHGSDWQTRLSENWMT